MTKLTRRSVFFVSVTSSITCSIGKFGDVIHFRFFLGAPAVQFRLVTNNFHADIFKVTPGLQDPRGYGFWPLRFRISKKIRGLLCVFLRSSTLDTLSPDQKQKMMFLYVTRELLHGFPFNLKPCWISSCCIELQSLGSKTLAVVEISPIAVLAAAPILKRNTFLGISLELLHGFSFKL